MLTPGETVNGRSSCPLHRHLAFVRHRLVEVADRLHLAVDRLVEAAVDGERGTASLVARTTTRRMPPRMITSGATGGGGAGAPGMLKSRGGWRWAGRAAWAPSRWAIATPAPGTSPTNAATVKTMSAPTNRRDPRRTTDARLPTINSSPDEIDDPQANRKLRRASRGRPQSGELARRLRDRGIGLVDDASAERRARKVKWP
jgi:hypothetical protein